MYLQGLGLGYFASLVTPSHVSKPSQKLCQRRQKCATVLGASELTTKYFFQKYAPVDLIEVLKLSWQAVSLGGGLPSGRQGADTLWDKGRIFPCISCSSLRGRKKHGSFKHQLTECPAQLIYQLVPQPVASSNGSTPFNDRPIFVDAGRYPWSSGSSPDFQVCSQGSGELDALPHSLRKPSINI